MSSRIFRFLLRWINTTVAVVVATKLVNGITYLRPVDLIVAALLLGILNVFVRPVLKFLSFPLMILTLGLFTFVINAALLYLVGYMMAPHFQVASFKAAFLGALVITIISVILNLLIGSSDAKVKVHRGPPRPPDRHDGGPVIDV